MSITEFQKVHRIGVFSSVHPEAACYEIAFDIIKTIENSEELKRIGLQLSQS